MKNVLCSLFLFLSAAALAAQTVNVWKGGFPGRESDWMLSANWSAGRIPSAFDQVLIPDATTAGAFYPEIQTGIVEIRQLIIEPDARLFLHPESMLVVDGEGISDAVVLNLGVLHNDGFLRIENNGRSGMENRGRLEGKGSVAGGAADGAVAAGF